MSLNLLDFRNALDKYPESVLVDLSGPIPKNTTFREINIQVSALIDRLQAQGVKAGDVVGVWLPNRGEWVCIMLALISLDCTLLAIPDEESADNVTKCLDEYGVVLLIADKTHPQVFAGHSMDIDSPEIIGQAYRIAQPLCIHVQPSPLWSFTSGSTGRPKCISARREGLEALMSEVIADFCINSRDSLLLFLPMASYQQYFLALACIFSGASLGIASPSRLLGALQQFHPTVLLAPPALYDSIASSFNQLPKWKQSVAIVGVTISVFLPRQWRRWVIDKVHAPIMRFFGGQIRLLFTGMAPLRGNTAHLFYRLQLPLFEVYGTTETGIVAWNKPKASRKESVGRVLRDVTLHFDAQGEIIVERSAMPTHGYVNDKENSHASAYLSASRVQTGDIGYIDRDGFLYLTGRSKNIIVLHTGEKLHPERVEKLITSYPGILQAVVAQNEFEDELAVIVVIDREELRNSVNQHISYVEKQLPSGCQFGIVIVTMEKFTRENGLLTSNLKLNRLALKLRFLNR